MPIQKFQLKWKSDFPWVKEGHMKLTAICTWCNTTISYDTMGRAALTSHAKGKKHQAMTINKEKTLPINHFCQLDKIRPNISIAEEQATTSSEVLSIPKLVNSTESKNSTLEKYKLKDSVTEAEIIWCLNTVMNYNSLRSSESCVLLFSKMFKECNIAKEMKLHKDKISYSIVFGLAPYFRDLLQFSLLECSHYVVGFDESFNKIAQRTQMDINIRFWDKTLNIVKSRYLGSVFINQSKATDILEAFKTGTGGLEESKILQISMDGPNVNWAFLNILKQNRNANLGPDAPQLLELGSCGLHVVNGAFKTAMNKTGWNLIQFLRSLYNLFKMVPARRGHFIEITGSSLFPLQFCTIRWVENSAVAKRAIEILPHLKKYIETVKGTDKEPTSHSFKIVATALKDNLILAKLAFFQSISEKLEPFLKEFQADSPMVPFLYDCLIELLRDIMVRFVKKEAMENSNFFKVEMFCKNDGLFKNFINIKEIDLGYATRSALKKCSGIKSSDIMDLRLQIRTCYQYLVFKIQEKSPLKFRLTKAVSFISPTAIASDKDQALKNLKNALDIMIEANILSASNAEAVDREYKEVISQPHFKLKAENYSRKEERIDEFWVKEFSKTEKLKDVIKTLLILSHGNAALERGFSINKEILTENMREDSLVAQRMIYDAISCSGGLLEWLNSPIPKKMIHSMRNAYSRFKETEELRRKTITEKDKRAAEQRKKAFELKELENKKKRTLEKMREELFEIDEKIKKMKT